MKKHSRPTVADLLALKGKRQLTMLRVTTLEEAEAAQKASIDILSVPPALLGDAFREAAPNPFAIPGIEYGDYVSAKEYMREAFIALKAGGDAVYCAASPRIIRRMREEGIPVCGHVGLIPSKATWTGGFRAVGKTAPSAIEIWRQTKALEEAGAFAVEIEVVPGDVAAAISRNTTMLMISMGAGSGCDAHSTCLPMMFLAPTGTTIPVMPRSIAISLPSMIVFSGSVLPPSASSPPTSNRKPILTSVIWFRSTTQN